MNLPPAGHLASFEFVRCANCNMTGHPLQDCIGPPDASGYVSGCPLCNVKGQLRFAGSGRPDDGQRPHGCQTPAKYPTP